jgi:hypothetical protein
MNGDSPATLPAIKKAALAGRQLVEDLVPGDQ